MFGISSKSDHSYLVYNTITSLRTFNIVSEEHITPDLIDLKKYAAHK